MKSGYHVAWLREVNQFTVSSSSAARQIFSLWLPIWWERIPSKVKTFVWRIVRGIYLTRCDLARKVHIFDIKCIFSHKEGGHE